VAIEPGPWVVSTSVESLIRAASAIRTSKRLRFGYQSHHGAATRRHIEPYAVLHTDGRWYLIGYCLSRKAMRTFRLDRAIDLEISATGFQRPSEFDPRGYLHDRMPFIQSDYQVDVWIDMPIAEAGRVFGPMRVVAEEQEGGTRLRCGRDSLEMFAGMLLAMGRKIIVHSPPELRETFRSLARQALQAANEPSIV
jgi:predicted DNA-binding transcriptional regulator YafY